MAEEDLSKPATKGDLLGSETRTDTKLAGLEERLDASIVASEARMLEAIRDSQTEVLRAFERYPASEHIKFRRLQADVSNIDASTDKRLDVVEQRLTEIEKKLFVRPPDAA